ncbi:MAG: GNAT family N-acetyltransferase [Deltaproteobacteria bacterium]|jgi:ribosomal protein S18 acetylase RimI-like enzyme|nr:GNAT family N-acetyltransferase [Deltaproteobacteria bacterium]
MSKSGRYGKYGEKKRTDRLRTARTAHVSVLRKKGHKTGDASPVKQTRSRKAPITIRPAEASDADFIRTLSRKAFAQYGPYEDLLPSWFLSGIGVTLVAFMGKRVAGYAMLERIQGVTTSPRVSELLAIAVEPSARNHGVGGRLMAEIMKKSRELLVERLILHTAVDNLPSQALFRKHGLTPCGVKTAFYPEGQSALMMQKDIS